MTPSLAGRVDQALHDLGVSRDDRVLVAASGGLDSTALVHCLTEARWPIVVAHIDHGLRDESAQDGAFVAALAESLGVPCLRLEVRVGAGNVQAEARAARYRALAELASEADCSVVATGHTATDQAETVLMAMTRGAGLRGLAGMAVRRALADGITLIRPLLHIPRGDLEAAAAANGWSWREDPSNATSAFLRNRVRHEVLPHLRAEGGAAVDARIAAAAADARAALRLAQGALAEVLDGERLDLARLVRQPEALRSLLVAEALATLAPRAHRSRALVARVLALAESDVGAVVDAGGVRVWRERDALRITTASAPASPGVLRVERLAAVPRVHQTSPWSVVVDGERARDPALRLFEAGDRIRPVGMDGSKRVSDLLRERGVPRSKRSAVPVVTVGGEVAWVVGHRLAASVAVTESTTHAERWTWAEGPG